MWNVYRHSVYGAWRCSRKLDEICKYKHRHKYKKYKYKIQIAKKCQKSTILKKSDLWIFRDFQLFLSNFNANLNFCFSTFLNFFSHHRYHRRYHCGQIDHHHHHHHHHHKYKTSFKAEWFKMVDFWHFFVQSVFCILYFVFCILYFVFCLLSFVFSQSVFEIK